MIKADIARNYYEAISTSVVAKNTCSVIEGLEEIIRWYDRNQQRLVKALVQLARENKVLKEGYGVVKRGDAK